MNNEKEYADFIADCDAEAHAQDEAEEEAKAQEENDQAYADEMQASLESAAIAEQETNSQIENLVSKSEEPMLNRIRKLYPLERNLVSDGFDKALEILNEELPLRIHKYNSGTKVWDWTIPMKWECYEAWIKNHKGTEIIMGKKESPLHVASYSLPQDCTAGKHHDYSIRGDALLSNYIISDPNRPDAIPYRFLPYSTNKYSSFRLCMRHNDLSKIKKDKRYQVYINSLFSEGELKVGEYTIRGTGFGPMNEERIIVICTHLCHPYQANDNLSGVSVAVEIAKELSKRDNMYTYMFLFLPETIGSIAFLSDHEHLIPDLKYGIFLEMLGNKSVLDLQHSLQENTKIDDIAFDLINNIQNEAARCLEVSRQEPKRLNSFRELVGNDEMVWNGPGVNCPMISISRALPSKPPFPEYHTHLDTPDIISESRLEEAKELTLKIINILESDYVPLRALNGPIMYSAHDLWDKYGSDPNIKLKTELIMCYLNGELSVYEISQKVDWSYDHTKEFIDSLLELKLVENINDKIIGD